MLQLQLKQIRELTAAWIWRRPAVAAKGATVSEKLLFWQMGYREGEAPSEPRSTTARDAG
jgi:hypothetical protein